MKLACIADADTTIAAVTRCGCIHWYVIGLELGLSHPQVMAEVHSIPTHDGKLRAVIETRRQTPRNAIVQELLKACNNIPNSIAGTVKDELAKQGELKKHP